MKPKAARRRVGVAAVLLVAFLAVVAGRFVPHSHDGRIYHSHDGGASHHAH